MGLNHVVAPGTVHVATPVVTTQGKGREGKGREEEWAEVPSITSGSRPPCRNRADAQVIAASVMDGSFATETRGVQ